MPPVVIAGAIAGAGAIGAAAIGSSAAKSAAQTQADANNAAIAAQQAQYQQTRSDLMPWQTEGKTALSQQGALLGLNGADEQAGAINQLKASPLYQSLFANGQDAVLQNASATGGLRGGNTQSSLANFGRDTLASVIENQLNQLSGVSTAGQNAAAQTGSLGQNSSTAISQLLANTGSANASGTLGAAGSQIGALTSLTSQLSGLLKGSSISSQTLASLTPSSQATIAANPAIF